MKETSIQQIPNNWETKNISDLCEVKRGASPRPIGDQRYFSDHGRGWIRISDVTSTYKYLRKTTQYLSDLGESRSVKVNPGDLIMSICATIGKPVILDMKACIHDGFVLFTNLSTNVDTEYLFYVLQMNESNFSNKRQTGTQGNLNTTLVGRTIISYPKNIHEQRKIVKILSTVDDAIQKSDELITKTEKMKNGFLNKFFKDDIIEEKLVNLDSVFDVKNGTTPSTKNKQYWDNPTINWINTCRFREIGWKDYNRRK
jgi:type I restriction enzyme, S subunit